MRYHDVFNGDADGICALHQLRLADPVESTLVTGLKRDIALLDRVAAQEGDLVTVLDVSLDRNRAALAGLLDRGVLVHYVDHHYAGQVPAHPNLDAMLDSSGAACTSALVDRHLAGRFRIWAVVAAFGDGLREAALALGGSLRLDPPALERLRELGETLNYNAYGESAADVLLEPIEVYRMVSHYADPFELMRAEPAIAQLTRERRSDLQSALQVHPLRRIAAADVYLLPDSHWSRRVSGTFANWLALNEPQRAHAVLVPSAGGYVVSVRSPRGRRASALEFCKRYNGGGRVDAAGIDRMEGSGLGEFLAAFEGEGWLH